MGELEDARAACNERQARFCERYMENPIAAHAVVEAGYSKKSATSKGAKLLAHPKIQRYLAALRNDMPGPAPVEILTQLRDRLFAVAIGREVTYGHEGKNVTASAPMTGQMSAARQLSRMLGGHSPKVQADVTVNFVQQLQVFQARLSAEAFDELVSVLEDQA